MAVLVRDRLKVIFEQALTLPQQQRADYLDQACGTNTALRAELDTLLAHYEEAPAFFDSLAGAVLPTAVGSPPPTGAEPDPLIGQSLSHYRIDRKLGNGGMGVVYQAFDRRLQRTVALKILSPMMTHVPGGRRQFVQEAQAASALDHPNICTVFEIDKTEPGQIFIVMAYYTGETLKEKINRGTVHPDEAVDYIVQAAKGLQQAHAAQIIHRDIKPANLIITDEGVLKVLDFGVATVKGKQQWAQMEGVLGTIPYMSPEQVQGQPIDHRADLWALGVVLYELLSDTRPFSGPSPQAVLYAIVHEEPSPLKAVNPEIPDTLAAVVDKLLQKEPDERYQSAADLQADLQADGDPYPPQRRAPAKHRRWTGHALATLLLLTLFGVLWALVQWREHAASVPPSRTAIAVLPFVVEGPAELDYLREGMVSLMALMLDGSGTLRAIDPHALLGYTAQHPDQVLDPAGGQVIAAHFEAEAFIVGTVVRLGTRTQLWATLYDANGLEQTTAQAAFTRNEELGTAVGALAQRLMDSLLSGSDDPLARLNSSTTTSFEALKAYLEADHALRVDHTIAAIGAARRAVSADSTFALGWHQLAQAINGHGPSRSDEALTAQAHAMRYRTGLPNRSQRLIEAYSAYQAGNLEDAERQYQSILHTYPEDIGAWGYLGDLRYHYNPLRGRPAAAARIAFEQVLFYQPNHQISLDHLLIITAKAGDLMAFDALAAPLLQSPENRVTRDFYHLIRHDAHQKERIYDAIGTASLVQVSSLWQALLEAEHVSSAQRLASAYAALGNSPEAQHWGQAYHGRGAAGLGQWKTYLAYQADRSRQDPRYAGTALVNQVLFHVLPFTPAPKARLDSLERRVVEWDTTAAPFFYSGTTPNPHAGQQGYLQQYMLGLLRWHQGDLTGTLHYADQLRHRTAGPSEAGLADSFARTLEALVAWDQYRPTQALEALDDAALQPHPQLSIASPFNSQAFNRYVRAEILFAEGRHEAAIPWYRSLYDGPFSEQNLVFAGPSYRRRAACYEALGQIEQAIDYYSRYVSLWATSDPDERLQVEAAHERLHSLLEMAERNVGHLSDPNQFLPPPYHPAHP